MNTKKMIASLVGVMLIATVLVMAVSAAGFDRDKYLNMPRMVYEFDANDSTGIYINDVDVVTGWAGDPSVQDTENVPTLRIYGEEGAIYPTHSYYGTDDFVYPDPVDPFDPGIMAKDSVTFDPAYMHAAVSVDGDLALEDDEKVFYRVFYEPGYAHGIDALMDATLPTTYPPLAPVIMPDGSLVTETTYMMVNDGACSSGLPLTGAVNETRFKLPTLSKAVPNELNPGMDNWTDTDADDPVNDDLVDLLFADYGGNLTNGTIEVGIEVHLALGESKRFMDHNITLRETCGMNSKFGIGYIGNRNDRDVELQDVLVPNGGPTVYVTRYNNKEHPPLYQFFTTDAEHRWFVRNVTPDGDCKGCNVTIGRRLVAGETFYVDGVRYDMPAIYVTDKTSGDEFKYITLQSPIPKCLDGECVDLMDYSHVSCQWLAMLRMSDPTVATPPNPAELNYVWVLPPFNVPHLKIDDINLAESGCPVDNITVNDAGEIFDDPDGALKFYYIEEYIEPRFNSSLAERHHIRKDGVEIWNWWNVYTKPYNYTTLVLPDDEIAGESYECSGTADGDEYIVTTSFIAPNSEADNRHADCKDPETHDIIDRAATIALAGDDRRDAYNGTPRMVFEYDAATDEDLFVNGVAGDPTVRVYGEAGAIYPTQSFTGADDFIYPDPVDPFDPGIIPKDSVTFNPAYIHGLYGVEPIKIGGSDGDEKAFLRAFYEPGYAHQVDELMYKEYPNLNDLRNLSMLKGAIVTETTYMLVDYTDNGGVGGYSGLPKAGAAGMPSNSPTRFMLPINSLDATVPGMDNARVVELTDAVCGDSLTSGEIEVSMTWDNLGKGKQRTFMDHRIKYEGIDTDGNPLVDLWYVGNMNDEHADFKNQVELVKGQKTYVDRPNLLASATSPRYRWFVTVQNTWNDGENCKMTLGRRLVAGETFYVDGVRYDMPAVYVTDDDGVAKFKYITFQSPLPKCDGPMWEDVLDDNQWDWSHVPSQWLANIVVSELDGIDGSGNDVTDIWVLPPFNENHTMIDDIGLDKSWNCGGIWENISVEAAGKILDGPIGNYPHPGLVHPLVFYYIAEEEEPRFDSSLAERHAYDGSDEIWNWWSIFTKPYQYTELVLPDQEDTGMSDGNEYLITTSFIAPNCEGAVRDMDNEPFCKPYDTHDIIDRAATLVDGTGSTECKGDFDDSGCIDFDDFVEFAGVYGSTAGDGVYNSLGDFDNDDDVDFDDFVEFAGVYGTGPNCP